MRKIISANIIAVFLVSSISVVNAQNNTNLLGQLNTITTAVPFLSISPDARAGGMGDLGGSYITNQQLHALEYL